MDTAALDELRALRARAYGPHADIDQDPAAVRRLRELESRHGGTTTTADVTPPAAEPPARVTESSALPGEHAPEPAAAGPAPILADPVPDVTAEAQFPPDAASPSGARPKLRISRTVGVLWGLSVVASAALATGITYAAVGMTPVSVSSGAPQIATLESTSLVDLPAGWFGAGPSSRVFEFYGLTLFESSQGYGLAGSDCLTVVVSDQLPTEDSDASTWPMNAPMYSGCGVGDFPATVELPVDSNAPQQLRDRYPEDSAVQFVLDGDRVGVFLDSD